MNNLFHFIQSDSLDDMEIVCIFDGYEPQLAQIVCETIAEQSELTIGVMINLACDAAWRETRWN